MSLRNFDSEDEVTIKCNKCGEIYSFFPLRVMFMKECKCGNDNWGRVSQWDDLNFGDFTFIQKQKVSYYIN